MSIKAIEMGRDTDAEEWAMRWASQIAEKHLPAADFKIQSALTSDIAEALTHVKRSWDTSSQ